MCCYFDDIMRVLNIHFSDILLDKKSYENILFYNISYKTFMGAKSWRIWFEKIDSLKFMMELDIQCYLILSDMMQFITGIDIL